MRRTTSFIAIALVAAACGGGGGNSSQSSPPASPSASSTGGGSSGCTDLSAGPVFTLAMKDLQFHPSCFKAKSAQSIHIVNEDSVLHNFTIEGTQVDVDVQPGKFFNGESAGLAPGTYQFFCKYHKSSGMTGQVIVTS